MSRVRNLFISFLVFILTSFCVQYAEAQVCTVNGTSYNTLEDALAYANNNPNTACTIVMTADYTLPAGDYTLPAKASLIVPYASTHNSIIGATPVRVTSYTTPSKYRRLTFASGAKLTAFGKIETGCTQNVNGQGATGTGNPSGPYGHIILNTNSLISLENGSFLYCWGYITGTGEIDAKRGAEIHEQFQVYDWKGGSRASTMVANHSNKVFPVNQYFIQNIESATTFHPGSSLICAFGVYVSSTIAATDVIKIIGNSGAMFLLDNADDSEDTWVKKKYDATLDRQVYEINSSAQLGSMQIPINASGLNLPMNSSDYVLPITSNMYIHLLSGYMGITQNTELLPGAQIEVNKSSSVEIISGKSLYLYDSDQWGYYVFDNVTAQKIKYTPSWSTCPRAYNTQAALGDAGLNVHGTIEVSGTIYTTQDGANIFSTNADAGTITFGASAPSNTSSIYQPKTYTEKTGFDKIWGALTGELFKITYAEAKCPSAKLKNGDGTYEATAGTAAGKSFCYVNDKWRSFTTDGCFVVDQDGVYYAKPHDYVALLSDTENAEHLYVSADGTRTFILDGDNCQWWEVTYVDDNLYYCATNGNYYAYDSSETTEDGEQDDDTWHIKKFYITWNNFDGTEITSYEVAYNSMPKYLGETPKRPLHNKYYTYDFKGWMPDFAPVTGDAVYTALFEAKDCMYTITFKNTDGSTIETQFLKMGEFPVCQNAPAGMGTTLEWTPIPSAVTGDQTYQAQTKPSKASYTIKFVNFDGTTLQTSDVAAGVLPVYAGAAPIKNSTTDRSFTWNGWTPDITTANTDATYVAKYTTTPVQYTITFEDEDGEVVEELQYNYGQMPSCSSVPASSQVPSQEGYEWVFTNWEPLVGVVTGDATYTPLYEERKVVYPAIGPELDIVDWTGNSLTLNMNGYSSATSGANWQIVVNGNTYTKDDRATDRTLTISGLTLNADASVLIKALNNNGVVESQHYYKIPHLITSNTSQNSSNANSIVWLKSGNTLTLEQNAQAGTIVVEPGATLIINTGKRLACNKLVLKTTAASVAELVNYGTLSCNEVYYTRIVADKSQAYQLALPFSSDLTAVKFSNGKTAEMGAHYGLQYYDADSRAQNGILKNWVCYTGTTLQANTGYQLLSASPYYCEYYFPVSYEKVATGASIAVRTQSVGEDADKGWNFIALPYTSSYTCTQGNTAPEDQVKICTLNADNKTFTQDIPTTLKPASPFYYQATQNGRLIFGGTFEFVTTAGAAGLAPRRVMAEEEKLPTQWLRLHYEDKEGNEDVTNLFMNPAFTLAFEQGYDVQKLSTSGEKPFVYTTLPCGEMAFSALPDGVGEQGVPLTVFTPGNKSMRIYLDENEHMRRMKHVYLLDDSLRLQTDLLKDDYVFDALEGTSAGRFYLKLVFKMPSEMTDLADETNSGWNDIQWDGENISITNITGDKAVSIYDVAGRMIGTAQDIDHAQFSVPATGVYLIKIGSEVKKVVLNK